MATRGREVNRVYVNTAIDHDATDELDAREVADTAEVLQHALQASDIDQSAHEVAEIEAARERVADRSLHAAWPGPGLRRPPPVIPTGVQARGHGVSR
jgi:hypothetical protein